MPGRRRLLAHLCGTDRQGHPPDLYTTVAISGAKCIVATNKDIDANIGKDIESMAELLEILAPLAKAE